MQESSFEKQFTSGHESHPEAEEVGAEVMNTALEIQESHFDVLAQKFPEAFAVAKNMDYFYELNPADQEKALTHIEDIGVETFIQKQFKEDVI